MTIATDTINTYLRRDTAIMIIFLFCVFDSLYFLYFFLYSFFIDRRLKMLNKNLNENIKRLSFELSFDDV